MTRWQWLLIQMTRKLWFRATAFSILAVATALVALLVKPYISEDISARVGADSVDKILTILASSMLAVTTFSVSTLVAAYGGAASNVTPRAIKLLMEDSSTQNMLATFIGSFLFSLVGIIALSSGIYGNAGRVVLFVVTMGVVLLIVVTLLRWIDHVSSFGRLGPTTERIEQTASAAARAERASPCLGAAPLIRPTADDISATHTVSAWTIGYVQHIDVQALQAVAEQSGTRLYVQVRPGAFVDPFHPMVRSTDALSDAHRHAVEQAFTVGDTRSFDQDPRFGLCVLTEVASRALSPATNDPGTAIDIIGRLARLMVIWSDHDNADMQTQRYPRSEEILYPDVYIPPVALDDLFDDAFTPIAIYGAGNLEVGIKLQKALAILARVPDPAFKTAAKHHSVLALARAEDALAMEVDIARLRQLAGRVGHGG